MIDDRIWNTYVCKPHGYLRCNIVGHRDEDIEYLDVVPRKALQDVIQEYEKAERIVRDTASRNVDLREAGNKMLKVVTAARDFTRFRTSEEADGLYETLEQALKEYYDE